LGADNPAGRPLCTWATRERLLEDNQQQDRTITGVAYVGVRVAFMLVYLT
jgi:hypothetical protein